MVAYATRLSGLETAGRWFILFGDGMHRRLEDGGRGSAMSCVENDLYFDWSGHPGHVQSWTPLPKPAHFHFAVPTSHQQLLFSGVCHCQAQCLQGQRICFECGGPGQAWPAQVTRPKDHRRSWTRGTAHHRSCSSPRPKSHRCQSLKRVERRRSFARRERRGSKPLLRATNALLTGSTRIAESQRLCCFPHQCRLHPPFDSCHGLFVFELVIFLPNPRRSKAQHRLAVGSSRTVSHAAQRRDDIRQLVYFEEVGVNLRVGILMDED